MTREYKGGVYRFGARLREWRQEAGVTQGGLAHALGVKQQTVSDWERGHTLPHHTRARAIEEHLRLAPQTVWLAITEENEEGPTRLLPEERLERLEQQVAQLVAGLQSVRDELARRAAP